MRFLKDSTYSLVSIGPIVSAGDGITPVTDVALSAVDNAFIIKEGGTSKITISGNDFTHIGGGIYNIAISAGDSDTLGKLRLYINDTDSFLPFWEDFMVLPENVYDSLVLNSDYLETDSMLFNGNTSPTILDSLLSSEPNQLNVNVASVGTNVDSITGIDDFNSKFPDGAVYCDSEVGVTGTTYPIGTSTTPVSAIGDALTIAVANNLNKIYIHGEVFIGGSDIYDGMELLGNGGRKSTAIGRAIFNMGTARTVGCTFKNLKIAGTQSDNGRDRVFYNCEISTNTAVLADGEPDKFYDCDFTDAVGDYTLASSNNGIYFHNCDFKNITYDLANNPSADMRINGGSGRLTIKDSSGGASPLLEINAFNGNIVNTDTKSIVIVLNGLNGSYQIDNANNSGSSTLNGGNYSLTDNSLSGHIVTENSNIVTQVNTVSGDVNNVLETIISKEDSISATQALQAKEATLLSRTASITGTQALQAKEATLLSRTASITGTQALQATEISATANRNLIRSDITTISGDVNTILTSAHGDGQWDATATVSGAVVLSGSQPYYAPALESTLQTVKQIVNFGNNEVYMSLYGTATTSASETAGQSSDPIYIENSGGSSSVSALPMAIAIARANKIDTIVMNNYSMIVRTLSADSGTYNGMKFVGKITPNATDVGGQYSSIDINTDSTAVTFENLRTSHPSGPYGTATYGRFKNCLLSGQVNDCGLYVEDSIIEGKMLTTPIVGSWKTSYYKRCRFTLDSHTPTWNDSGIDMRNLPDGNPWFLRIDDCYGRLWLYGLVNSDTEIIIDNFEGELIIDPTCVSGHIHVYGGAGTITNSGGAGLTLTSAGFTTYPEDVVLSASQPNYTPALQATLLAGVDNISGTQTIIVGKSDAISATQALQALQATLLAGVDNISGTQSTIISKEDAISATQALQALQSTLLAGVDNISATQISQALEATLLSRTSNISATQATLITNTNNIYSRIGVPVSGTIAQDIANIASAVVAGLPSNFTAITGTLPVGTNNSGDYTDTWTADGTMWETSPEGTPVSGFGLIQQALFNLSGSHASSINIVGYFDSGVGRYVDVYAYNYSTSGYDQLSNSVTRMNNESSLQNYQYTLLSNHQDADGNVLIRFATVSSNATDDFFLDQLLVEGVLVGATTDEIAQAVYDKFSYQVYSGAVWINTQNGVTGTDIGIHGIPTNPVNNYDDAMTIANSLGVKRFEFSPDSTITLTGSHAYWTFNGKGIINLNGQNIDDAVFIDIELLDGISTGDDITLIRCRLFDIEAGSFNAFDCTLGGEISGVAGSNYTFIGTVSDIPGLGTSKFIFPATGDVAVGYRNYSGGIQVEKMVTGDRVSLEGQGQLIIHSTVSGGTIAVRGAFDLTDNVVGGFESVGTFVDTARWNEEQNVKHVTGNVSGSVNDVITPIDVADVVLSASQPNYAPALQSTLLAGVDNISATQLIIIGKEDSISATQALQATQASLLSRTASITGTQALQATEISATANRNLIRSDITTISGDTNSLLTSAHGSGQYDQVTSIGEVVLSASQPNYAPALQSTLVAGVNNISGTQVTIISKEDAISATQALQALQSTLLIGIDNLSGSNGTIISKEDSISASIDSLGSPMQDGTEVVLSASQPSYAPAKASDVDSSLVNYDSGNGVAKENSVLSIQNNTRFVTSIPTYMIVPISVSADVYKITVNFYDTSGTMEDPDNSDLAIDVDTAGAISKNAYLFQDYASTTALTASSNFPSSKALVKIGTGKYECYYQSVSGATAEQLVFSFSLKENGENLYYSRTSVLLEEVPGTSILADNNTNKDIIANALKTQDVQATSAVNGSVYQDLLDDIGSPMQTGEEVVLSATQSSYPVAKQTTLLTGIDNISATQVTIIAKEDAISATQALQATEISATANKDSILSNVSTVSGDVWNNATRTLTSLSGLPVTVSGAVLLDSSVRVVLSASQPDYNVSKETSATANRDSILANVSTVSGDVWNNVSRTLTSLSGLDIDISTDSLIELRDSIWGSMIEYVDETDTTKQAEAWVMLQAIFSTIKQRLKRK